MELLKDKIDLLINNFEDLDLQIKEISNKLIEQKKIKFDLHKSINIIKNININNNFKYSSQQNKLKLERELNYNIIKFNNDIKKNNIIINNYLQILDKFYKLKKIIIKDGIFECSICCDFKVKIITGYCGHIICNDCYDELKKNKCPLCNVNYNNKIIKLYF